MGKGHLVENQHEKERATGNQRTSESGTSADPCNGAKSISADNTADNQGKPCMNESIKMSELIIMAGFSFPFIKSNS